MNSRLVAYALLEAVDEEDAYANLVLPKLLANANLKPRDAAFATELGYGSLRMRGWLHAVIERVSSRPLERIDPAVRRVLELGAYQLLETRTSVHAAVSETVSLARAVGASSAAGFVNASLRRISERGPDEWADLLADRLDIDAARATLSSHPEWIIDELDAALDRAGAGDELDALLHADNTAAAVNMVSLPGIGPELEQLGTANRYSPVGAAISGGNPAKFTRFPGARVQDEGSQLAALALSRARAVRPGERWIDVCAGPGGKAALLAAEAAASGASFIANELSAHRADLVRSALNPVSAETEVRVGDARVLTDGPFDRIMLDAPCSGLGALRRRPEARWRKRPSDVTELVELQAELFDSALAMLAPGGLLAYVTCSPVLAETAEQVERVVAAGTAVLLDTASVLDGISLAPLDAAVAIGSGTAVQLWPHRHGTDAMFIALLSTPTP